MSDKTVSPRTSYFHPDDPAGWLKPDEPFMVDGLDWAWAFVVYKSTVGFDGYRVGSNGIVWSCRERTYSREFRGCRYVMSDNWTRMTQHFSLYAMFVGLSRGTKAYSVAVHILVLEAFVCSRPEGMYGLHWDDDQTNNRLSNLRWGTQLDNAADCVRNGRMPRGEIHHRATFTEDEIIGIRQMYDSGTMNQVELAAYVGAPKATIREIIIGTSWTHVGGPIAKPGKGNAGIGDAKRMKAIELLVSGVSPMSVCEQLKISRQTVRRIIRSQKSLATP